MRILRAFSLALAATAICAVFASAAHALPAGFWGVVPQSPLTAEQYQRLGTGGVESIRLPVNWGSVQSSKGAAFDWSGYDNQIEEAAKSGIKVLPFLAGAPQWAVPSKKVPGAGGLEAPAFLPVSGAARTGWVSFMTAAVARYGPNGSFWAEHPGVPKRPIRTWQIWNEPNFKYFIAKPNPAEYGKLVKISHTALRAADPGAQIVLAGLFARPKGARTASGKHKSLNWYASDFLDRMYATTPGLKARFNGVALHPYTIRANELTGVTDEFRDVLTAHGDAAKGLWMTELGWSSSKGSPANLFGKGRAGQARELRTSFTILRNKQAKWKVKSIFWFSVDDAPGACNFCDGSGLFASGFVPKPAWFDYVRFAGGTP
jgi:polysaccharide biosynthesis protein PslG